MTVISREEAVAGSPVVYCTVQYAAGHLHLDLATWTCTCASTCTWI